jgi:hypothetical protein
LFSFGFLPNLIPLAFARCLPLIRPRQDQVTLELSQATQRRNHQLAVRRVRYRWRILHVPVSNRQRTMDFE